MEGKKTITKEEAREAVAEIVQTVAILLAVCETTCPGCREVCLDVLIEELEKLKSKKANDAEHQEQIHAVDDLMQTAAMMGSEDYKERFKAEYYHTKIRYDKLHKMCVKYEAGKLDFTPTCSLELLKEQKAAMGNYLRCLEIRAELEEVAL